MFHDTVMSLVVVVVIIGLACIWKFTAGEEPSDAGWLGPLYAATADPGTTTFVPRPDWYFYFLFYLLRIFKWPDVGDPRHGRHPDDRDHPAVRAAVPRHAAASGGCCAGRSRSSRSCLVVDLDGRPHLQGRDREGGARRARRRARAASGQQDSDFADNARVAGRDASSPQAGCLNCHTYVGAGSSNLGAPDLTAIGAKSRRASTFQFAQLRRQPARSSATTSCRVRPDLHRRAAAAARRVPRGSKGHRQRASLRADRCRRAMRVFLGITGASGAPYAARLLEALAGAGCEVGVCASAPGSRCSRPSCTATRRCRATRCSRASSAARATASTVYDRPTTARRTRAARRGSTPT